jgi:hypothetical protein
MKVPKFKLRVKISPERVHIPKAIYDRNHEKDEIEHELQEYEEDLRYSREELELYLGHYLRA